MTEIKIEKKKPVWPWLLLVLGLLAAVWFIFFRNNKADNVVTVENVNKAMIEVRENNGVVENYISFINSDTNTMTLDHAYTSNALAKLTAAVDAMAIEVGYDIKLDIAKAKVYAEEITKDPLVTNHADKIRSAADVLSTCMQNIQQAKYPELTSDANEVKNAAAAIIPETLTLEQRDKVKSFFKKAADLLTKMN